MADKFENFDTAEEANRSILQRFTQLQYINIFLFLILIILTSSIIGLLCIKSPNHTSEEVPNDYSRYSTEASPISVETLGPGAIIEKKSWGGKPALNSTTTLRHPTTFVVIGHTATPQCENFNQCSARVRQIQNYQMSVAKSPDISSNFLIGGDGNVYVGTGWDIQNFDFRNDSISVAFIGNYVYDYLTPDMINAAKKLMHIGIESGKLSNDYKIVGRNQTFPTLSPGRHVYEVIKTWPHFDSTYIT